MVCSLWWRCGAFLCVGFSKSCNNPFENANEYIGHCCQLLPLNSLLINTLFGNITMASLSLAGERNVRKICGLDRGTINNGLSSAQIHNNTGTVNKASLTPSPRATYSASAVKNVTHLCGLLAQQTAAPSKPITVPGTERLSLDLLA